MPINLEPNERDAIFAQISADFTLFGDLERAMAEGDEEACYRLARKLSDGLRLLVDGGLGWKRRSIDPTVLTLPDADLRRIMSRTRSEAVSANEALRPDREESQEQWDEMVTVIVACDSVMEQTHHD